MEKRFNKWKFYIFIIFFISFINPASSQTAEEWVKKGNAFEELGEHNKSIEAYDKAIAINPNYKYAWFDKGIAHGKLGEYDKAIDAFDRVINIYPNDKLAWFNKGSALSKLGEYDKAIEAYDRATAIDPNFTAAWNNKGIALSRLGEDDKAIDAFDKVIALDPNDIDAKRSRDFTKMKNWIIIGGIALFIVIGLIALRNIKYKRNNNSQNVNPDYNINKWKIFGYVAITWFVFSILAKIYADVFWIDMFDAMLVVWAWMALLFGIVMAYRLKKNIELVYAFVIFFIIIFASVIGILVGIGYFRWSFIKLEKQNFRKEQTTFPIIDESIGIEKMYLGGFLKVLGYIVFAIFGLWGFILDLYVVYAAGGSSLLVIGILTGPITFLVAPWYAAIALGYWDPLIIGYGGGLVAWVLIGTGSAISGD